MKEIKWTGIAIGLLICVALNGGAESHFFIPYYSIRADGLMIGCTTNVLRGDITLQGDITICDNTNMVYRITDEGIRKLGKSGRICEVFGHQWRPGRPGEGEGSACGGWYLDYHPNTTYRTCRICGKHESQTLNDWK